jgi:hypothetical protein
MLYDLPKSLIELVIVPCEEVNTQCMATTHKPDSYISFFKRRSKPG